MKTLKQRAKRRAKQERARGRLHRILMSRWRIVYAPGEVWMAQGVIDDLMAMERAR